VILLCGMPSERPVALAVAAAREAGAPHLVLDQRRLDDWSLRVELDGDLLSGALSGPEGSWDIAEFSGVYVRMVEDRTGGLYHALLEWLEVADCRVANRLGPSASNMSKPYQSQHVLACGLRVPPTTVTNDPDEVRRFAAEHERVIFKSVSSTRSIVRELSGARVRDLDRVRHLPTQFQALVPGVDVRVHVAGTAIHATEVASEAIDYRYASREAKEVRMQSEVLPAEVSTACLRLSEALELPFCGIDLRRTPDGHWYCFEANPSPAYSYYEELTGQPIGRALIDYLGGANGGGEDDGAGD
jgi:hypothetical protein